MKKSTKLRAGWNPPMFLVSLHSQQATWMDIFFSTSGDWFSLASQMPAPHWWIKKYLKRGGSKALKQGNPTYSNIYVWNSQIPNSQFPILNSQFSNFPLLPQTSRGEGVCKQFFTRESRGCTGKRFPRKRWNSFNFHIFVFLKSKKVFF